MLISRPQENQERLAPSPTRLAHRSGSPHMQPKKSEHHRTWAVSNLPKHQTPISQCQRWNRRSRLRQPYLLAKPRFQNVNAPEDPTFPFCPLESRVFLGALLCPEVERLEILRTPECCFPDVLTHFAVAGILCTLRCGLSGSRRLRT